MNHSFKLHCSLASSQILARNYIFFLLFLTDSSEQKAQQTFLWRVMQTHSRETCWGSFGSKSQFYSNAWVINSKLSSVVTEHEMFANTLLQNLTRAAMVWSDPTPLLHLCSLIPLLQRTTHTLLDPWPLEGLSHFISAQAGSGSTQLKQVVAMPKTVLHTLFFTNKIKDIELLSRLHCGWMTGILHLITCLLTKTSVWWKPALNCLLAFNLEAKDKTLKNHLIITESERKKWSIWRNFYVIWGKVLLFKIFTWTYFFSKSLNVEVICRKSGNGQKRHIHLNNKLYIYS